MDRVRFGRALGTGAREAAKALMKAADAATAPNPAGTQKAAPVTRKSAGVVARKAERVKLTTAGVKRGGKRFGEAMWGPFAKAGGVLWLEVTGVLFGMFAAAFGVWVWKVRGDLRGVGEAKERAWFAVAMLMVFVYFTVSNYVRAAKRGRR